MVKAGGGAVGPSAAAAAAAAGGGAGAAAGATPAGGGVFGRRRRGGAIRGGGGGSGGRRCRIVDGRNRGGSAVIRRAGCRWNSRCIGRRRISGQGVRQGGSRNGERQRAKADVGEAHYVPFEPKSAFVPPAVPVQPLYRRCRSGR